MFLGFLLEGWAGKEKNVSFLPYVKYVLNLTQTRAASEKMQAPVASSPLRLKM